MRPPAVRPTTRGVAALAAFVLVAGAAVVTGTPELVPLAVVIGVPLVVGPWVTHRRARRSVASAVFHAHREPGAVEAGAEMQVRLSLTHRPTHGPDLPPLGLAPVGGQWRARGAGTEGASRHLRLAPSVPSLLVLPHPVPGTTATCGLAVPTGRRGVFELPPQPSWVHDPIGLFGAPGPVTPLVIAVVHPVPTPLDRPTIGPPAPVVGGASAVHAGAGDGQGELEGIRPYVAGDRLSLLHWPAKARYGTWFVRQFGVDGAAALSLVVDDRAGVHRRVDFDRLVGAALWAVIETTHGARAVRLSTLSGRTYSFEPTERGRADARLVLATMQPVAARAPARFAAPAADAVVLTTATGAARLTPGSPGPGPPGGSDGRGGAGVRTARVVVV